MDLLASYGSDEEDDEQTVQSSPGVFTRPPPRTTAKGESDDDEPMRRKSGPHVGPKAESLALPSDFFYGHSAGIVSKPSALPSNFFSDIPEVSRHETSAEANSSLFGKLPPPSSSTRLSFPSLPPPSNPKLKKKTVEFKPPVNLSVLEFKGEDDPEHRKKRPKVSEVNKTGSEAKVGGLAGLLPPPKNSLGSGFALGGGGGAGGGRRTAMETASGLSKPTKEVNLPQPSAGSTEGGISAWQSTLSSSETQMRVHPNTQYHYSAQPGQGRIPSGGYSTPQERTREKDYAEEQCTVDGGYQNGIQGYTNWHYSDSHGVAPEPSSGDAVSDPLSEVLQRERRKGKNEPPPQFIEVKQADLTAGRVREDQLRTTGIAFGPSYQPVSAGKDKPSKIHRRKHQIGALYFDMKSKEMELLDRRSKGNLTKAETQAKYGW